MQIKIVYLNDYREYIIALGLWSFEICTQYDLQTTRKSQIDKFRQRCNVDSLPLTLLALDDKDKLIGMCSLVQTDNVQPDLAPWLSSHYVVPNYRNQRVGEKLLEATKQTAKKLSFEKLYLFTFDANLTLYYSKRGWEIIGKDSIHNHPISIMEISLS